MEQATIIDEFPSGDARVQDFIRQIHQDRTRAIEDQTTMAVAAAMLKLGERVLTITTADIAKLHGRRVSVEQTAEGVQIKIV